MASQTYRILVRFLIFLVVGVSTEQVHAQRWTMQLSSPEDAHAFNFYQRLLADFKNTRYWPKGGDTADFVLEKDSAAAPQMLGFFLPTDNSIHLFTDTGKVMTTLRHSMTNPTQQEMWILLQAALLVHEFSAHWVQHNYIQDGEKRDIEKRFQAAFETKTLNDSIMAGYLYEYIVKEKGAYLLTLRFLSEQVESGKFSKRNFQKTIGSSATGFYSHFHDAASVQAQFLFTLSKNVRRYESKTNPSVAEQYAREGYIAIVALLTKTIHEIYSFEQKPKSRK